MEGADELGQGLVAGVDGDAASGLIDHKAIVDIGLFGTKSEGLAALDFAKGRGVAGWDAAIIDGEIGVGRQSDFGAFDSWVAGQVEVAVPLCQSFDGEGR